MTPSAEQKVQKPKRLTVAPLMAPRGSCNVMEARDWYCVEHPLWGMRRRGVKHGPVGRLGRQTSSRNSYLGAEKRQETEA